jgi:C2 domain
VDLTYSLSPSQPKVKVDLWHDSRLGLDDFLGCVRFPLEDLMKTATYGSTFDVSCPLKKRNKDSDKLQVTGTLMLRYMINDKLNEC